jgi:hypothetical protein
MRATLIVSTVLLLSLACRETVVEEGRWRVERLHAVVLESGARPQRLVRTGRGVVAEFVSSPRFYREQDCVIFLWRNGRPMWSFVCGDKSPTALVAYTGSDGWFTDSEGLSRWTRIALSGGSAIVVKTTYRVADLANGDMRVSNLVSPITGDTTNPATNEPAWVLAFRTSDCETLRALPNIPLHEIRPYDSPLIEAVRMGNRCAVDELIRRGARVNARSSSGDTALVEAVNQRNVELLMLLLPFGDEAAKAAATERARMLDQPEILELLERQRGASAGV